jgi:hypothetical protein
VISITKWHEYQKENNKSNNKRTTNEQQTNTDNNDKNEKKKTIPHLENAEEIFEKCWAEYPRKKGRPEAFDFFKRSVKNIDDARRLFMAIQSYKEEVEGEELKFIKYGSSFFNEKTWREYVPRDTDV